MHNYPDKFWEILSMQTGINIDQLLEMRLRKYEGYIEEKFADNGCYMWLTNLGNRDKVKNKFYNLRYCPLCLKEALYFKQEWRLLYITICSKHKVYLLVDCQECHKSIKLKHINIFQDIYDCNCGYDLREASILKASINDLLTLHKFNDIAKNGHTLINGIEEHSLGFFFILRVLCKKILIVEKYKECYLEELTPQNLAALLTQAFDILDDWPNNLKHFCKKYKLTNTNRLLAGKRHHKDIPYWFKKEIDLFLNARYRKSEEEIDAMFRYLYKNKTPTLKEIEEVSGWNFSYGGEMRMKWLKR